MHKITVTKGVTSIYVILLQPGLQNFKYIDLLVLEEMFPNHKVKLLFSTSTKLKVGTSPNFKKQNF